MLGRVRRHALNLASRRGAHVALLSTDAPQLPQRRQNSPASASTKRLEALLQKKMPKSRDEDGRQVVVSVGAHTSWWHSFMRKWRGQTVDLGFTHDAWQKHQSAWRHITSLSYFASGRRLLFPDLLAVGVCSSYVTWHNTHLAHASEKLVPGFNLIQHHEQMVLPALPFSISALALGLLVTFRTQESHRRYVEARTLWGLSINTCRDVASILLARTSRVSTTTGKKVVDTVDDYQRAWVQEHGRPVELVEQPEAVRHAIKLLQTYMHVLKYHLTVSGCNFEIVTHDRTDAGLQFEKDAALLEELQAIWNISLRTNKPQALMDDKDDVGVEGDENEDDELSRGDLARMDVEQAMVTELMGVQNRPLWVLNELNRVNAQLFGSEPETAEHGGVSDMSAQMRAQVSTRLDERVTILQNVLGGCERILRTPIYTPYTRHTSRFLTIWCSALPCALFPVVGPTGTIPVTMIIAYMMLGIEEIGSRCEEPFSVLPLWQYCQAVDQSCDQLLIQDGDAEADSLRGDR